MILWDLLLNIFIPIFIMIGLILILIGSIVKISIRLKITKDWFDRI